MITEKPFNLVPCKKIKTRKRTLGGETIFYHTYFEPKDLNREERISVIHRFKYPETLEDKYTSDSMVQYSVEQFFKIHNISDFDYICGLHSSSKVVKNILKVIKNKYPLVNLIPELISKTRMRNMFIREEILNKDYSLKTKEIVPISFNCSKTKHYDKVSKVSYYPARFRRYFGGFLKINEKYMDLIKGRRILLIDDTFGEGLTLCESSRLLKPYIKSLTCFTVMKDFCNNIKKV